MIEKLLVSLVNQLGGRISVLPDQIYIELDGNIYRAGGAGTIEEFSAHLLKTFHEKLVDDHNDLRDILSTRRL